MPRASTFYPPASSTFEVGNTCHFAEVGGSVWWTINAYYADGSWWRVDVTKPAWGLQVNVSENMIYESYQATTYWTAQPAANPISPVWASVGGWEMVYSYSKYRDFTVGGGGCEYDGHGAVDHHGYGRFQHAKISDVTYTGIIVNAFLDQSGRDNSALPSWQVGIKNTGSADQFRIARAPGGGGLTFADLLTLTSAGVVFIANGTPPGSNPTGGVYLYAEDGALKARGASGTITTIAPA